MTQPKSKKYLFRFLTRDEYHLWNSFVDTSPQGSIFAKTFYLDAIGKSYRVGVLFKGDNIEGGIVLTKNELSLYSNPLFAKYLGIQIRQLSGKPVSSLTTGKNIIEEIVRNIINIRSFDFTFHPHFSNWLPFYWSGYRQEIRYTYFIDNLSDTASRYKNMHSKILNGIRRAEKYGIQIVHDISPDAFYRLNKLTYQRQGGSIPYSYDFFASFYQSLVRSGSIRLLGAIDPSHKLHAVSGIVYDARSCHLILNSFNPELPQVQANTLLIARTIDFASTVSRSFDFEGSMMKSIESFYRGFGGTLTPYYRIWKDSLFNYLKQRGIEYFKKMMYGK